VNPALLRTYRNARRQGAGPREALHTARREIARQEGNARAAAYARAHPFIAPERLPLPRHGAHDTYVPLDQYRRMSGGF
jgi:hypothetical protein